MSDFIEKLIYWVVFPFLGLLVLCLVFVMCVDWATSSTYTEDGVVMDRAYKAEINTTGYGVGFGGDGKLVTTYQTQHESEKYIVIVQLNTGVFSCETSGRQWVICTNGANVIVTVRVGGWTRSVLSRDI